MEHQIQQFETHGDDLPKQILADTVHGDPEGLEGYWVPTGGHGRELRRC